MCFLYWPIQETHRPSPSLPCFPWHLVGVLSRNWSALKRSLLIGSLSAYEKISLNRVLEDRVLEDSFE